MTDSTKPIWRIAVIGSGPSAFYAAQDALKTPDVDVRLDMFDRLPVPFGLVRCGVAPDHQAVKRVTVMYTQFAKAPGFRFFGNVQLGRDVQVSELEQRYDQIVYAFGCSKSSKIGLPGEELRGVHGAAEFVGWYNGHPDFSGDQHDLSDVRRVAVIGNGNVALDVARIMLQPAERLASSDISEQALEALRKSAVEEVVMLGRRGPAQAAFSAKEIEEIDEVDGVEVAISPEDAALDELSAAWLEEFGSRGKQRSVRFLTSCAERGTSDDARKLRCRFLVSPKEFVGSADKVEAVRVEHMEIYADGEDRENLRPRGTGQIEEIPCDMVLLSVGYRGDPVPGVPYDDRSGAVPNDQGRVLDAPGGEVRIGHYAVGWSKRGPTGIIGTNMTDSRETVAAMRADRDEGRTLSPDGSDISDVLAEKGVDVVSWEDWLRLDAWEVAEGKKRDRLRHKLSSVEMMMQKVRELRDQAD